MAQIRNNPLAYLEKEKPSPLNCEHIWLSDIECCVVLRKSGATFNQFYHSAVIEWEAGTSKLHPTQKPLGLIQYLIRSSTEPTDIILDPFMGSGTTALAARNLGRKFIGCDLSAEYVSLANTRLMNSDPYQNTTLSDGTKQLSLFRQLESA